MDPEATEIEETQDESQEDSYVSLTDATDEEVDAAFEDYLGNGHNDDLEDDDSEEEEEIDEEDIDEPEEEESEETEQKKPESKQAQANLTSENVFQFLQDQERRVTETLERIDSEAVPLATRLNQLEEELENATSPSDIRRLSNEITEVENRLDEAIDKKARIQRIHVGQKLFYSNVKPESVNLPAMIQEMIDDGVPEQHIRAFQQSPFEHSSPVELIHLSKRAEYRGVIGVLYKALQDAKSELEKVKGKPSRILRNVKKAQRSSGTTVTGRNGRTRGDVKNALKRIDPTKLSDDQLARLLDKT